MARANSAAADRLIDMLAKAATPQDAGGLKPCPFCGGKVKVRSNPLTGGVMFLCEEPTCGADVMFYAGDGKGRAASDALWQRRDG